MTVIIYVKLPFFRVLTISMYLLNKPACYLNNYNSMAI